MHCWNKLLGWGLKAIRIILKILKFLFRLIVILIKELFFYFPVWALFSVGLVYLGKLKAEQWDGSVFNLMVAVLAIIAALSGLSFNCAASCSDENEKNIFNKAGRNLFYSTLLLAIAGAMRFCFVKAETAGFLSSTIKFISTVTPPFFFYFGLVTSGRSLVILHRTLWKTFYKNMTDRKHDYGVDSNVNKKS
jgi:hypothetical protein